VLRDAHAGLDRYGGSDDRRSMAVESGALAATGIAGLDDVLSGGLPAKRLYLLQGRATVSQRGVVVVDDNDDLRSIVKELLEHAGYEVTTADTGPSSLTQIIDSHPDIAFVDIGLPGFDGYEVA
jgi:hypothetical protein